MTKGIIATTLDCMSQEVIERRIKSLKEGTFKIFRGRRVENPKGNCEMRGIRIALA